MLNEVLIVGFGNIAQEHYKSINRILPKANNSFLIRKKNSINKINNKIKFYFSTKNFKMQIYRFLSFI